MRVTINRRARGEAGDTSSQAAPANGKYPGAGQRASLYDDVTNRIISELEAGRFPWVQPWGGVGGIGPGLPRNATTGRNYSGVNILLLWGAAIEHGFPSQSWLTFRQALAKGGNVCKGERGTTVVFADRFTPKGEAEKAAREGTEPGTVAFLKRFTVFNLSQCEGLDAGLATDPEPLPEREIIPHAEALIDATGADFRVGGDKAFYVPSRDFICVPPQPAFKEQINYYRTCFHELGHWSGAKHRLNRNLSGGFGSKDYAREELVAEMTSAFVCASLGIIPTVRHADYIAAWLDLLKADNRAIFRAASQASNAADFILSSTAPEGEPASAAMPVPGERIAA